MDKCGHRQDCEVYCDASRQLVLTYNDFAVECYRWVVEGGREGGKRGKRRKEGDNTHIWHLISLLDNSAIVVSFVWCVFCLQAAAFQWSSDPSQQGCQGGEERERTVSQQRRWRRILTMHNTLVLLSPPSSSSSSPFPPSPLLLFLLPFSPPPPLPPPSLDCFYRMNNLHFALPDYQQALELDQSDWSIRCRIAIVFCELGVECFGRGQYSEAEQHFSSAIQHNPKVSRFYFCRARARHERKVRS